MKSKWWVPYSFLIIPLLLYSIWVIIPIFQTMFLSFTNWDGVSPLINFVGLKNFRELLKDSYSILSFWNNIKWLLGFAIVAVPLGLAVAMFLDQGFAGSKIYKTFMFLPMTLSFVVIGQIWSWIFEPRDGILNTFLSFLGIQGIGWLSDPKIVTYSLIMAALWRQIPYAMVIFLAGLKQVPKNLVDASYVDGANSWQRFIYVILPMLRPATVIAITVNVIDSLRAFDIIYVMTRGGPFYSSSVMANYMYVQAFHNYRMGYGSSIAVIQFLITLSFIIIYMRHVMKKEVSL